MTIASPRDLPSVERLLQEEALRPLLAREPRELVVRAVQETLDAARATLLGGAHLNGTGDLPARVEQRLQDFVRPPLRPVINATGVVIHTNLGRAPLSPEALAAVQAVALGYSNLEYDLERGERGSRHDLVTNLLRRLTGAEEALVVNNCAAALVLVLSALAQGRQAIISRGQLVEIGGGFRIPDVMRQAGPHLIEVGTTNRTYARDFEAAVSQETALLLRVHASNFRQVGFVHAPPLAELVEVAGRHGLPLVDDLGSGALLDTAAYGLAAEPTAQASVRGGASLVLFSGDKLLGGPQAGIILGRADLVRTLKKHPLVRALRPDKLTLAALGATLVHYVRGEAERKVPVWRMIAAPAEAIERRCRSLAATLPSATVVRVESTVGGGSLPGETLGSWAVALHAASINALAASLRTHGTPVVGRIEQGQLLLDLRTVLPEQDEQLTAALRAALASA